MTPNAVGFVTRAEAGLRPPVSVSRNITPQHGGLAAHWGGSGSAPSAHADCLKRWKAWQDFHMSKGWADIAYNFGYCNHGYVFAGRGLGVRSGAQGTTFGNQNFYAACWIGGEQSTPTRLAFEALLWLIQAIRNSGAGLGVRPHSWFKSTSCPGNDLRGFIAPYHGTEIQEDEVPLTDEEIARIWSAQFGPSTNRRTAGDLLVDGSVSRAEAQAARIAAQAAQKQTTRAALIAAAVAAGAAGGVTATQIVDEIGRRLGG